MSKYVLSFAAQKSLQSIYKYSIENFGKKRATEYISSIRNKLRELAKAPLTGKERNDIKRGFYSSFQGSHTIYYRVQPSHIEVIDILHQSMEPKLHLV